MNTSYKIVMTVERIKGIKKPATKLKIQLKLFFCRFNFICLYSRGETVPAIELHSTILISIK